MQKIVFVITIIILCAGCATNGLRNKGGRTLEAYGLVEAYPGSDAYIAPETARSSNNPQIANAAIGAQDLSLQERSQLHMSQSQRSQTASYYSAKEWPFQTFFARIYDYIGLPVIGGTAAAGIIYGVDQLVLGGGDSGGDDNSVTITGDNNTTDNNSGEGSSSDSHDTTGTAP